MPEETKKSYNPFKMWGSWAGVFAVLAWALIGIIEKTVREGFFSCATSVGVGGSNSTQCDFFEFLVSFQMIFVCLLMILGFLVGWIIHSLLRKFSK